MMKSIIIEYQKAFNDIMEDFKRNKNVSAVFTFGSMVSGDIWEESDIDFFVVYKNEFHKVRDIYSEVNGIPIHAKLLSKEKFMDSYENEGNKGTSKSILKFSKIVFSRDKEINSIYNRAIYGGDEYTHEENLEYLSKVIKEISICKKYIQIDRMYTAYEVMIRSLDSFSKLYLSLNGYTISKDSIRMAVNLNDSFKSIIDKRLFNGINKEDIIEIVSYIERYIEDNILASSKVILDILGDSNEYLSASEIIKNFKIVGSKVKVEQILKKLLSKGIIKKMSKKVIDKDNNIIINENVYGIE
ncbi:nucleotidyltransferase domain-containing protein [Clostridium sardiniense]|uniref:nucleotidyltransferase domain-containing protein n=1 Tax=Clostridium sardiniense TaxID=29369 RepID=UPI00195C8D6A|nr:nucleotidyltransferase domain-containing protein [Clostridium sardiniense]MBM7834296.1 putative nucleotidyltransferase [Clostridium sardiniense]